MISRNTRQEPRKTLVTIDENNDIGSDISGKWYILCATIVDDRYPFANVVGKREFKKPPKFHKNPKLRVPFLTEADPFIKRVYYVAVWKDKHHFSSDEQHVIHRTALGLLSDLIRLHEGLNDKDVVIDHTDMIPDATAQILFICSKFGRDGSSSAVVLPSKDSYELQTHDFVIGAVGKAMNHEENEWINLIHAEKVCLLLQTSDIIGGEDLAAATDHGADPQVSNRGNNGYTFSSKSVKTPSSNIVSVRRNSSKNAKGAKKNGNTKKIVGNPRCRQKATSQATQSSYGVQTTSPSKEGLRSHTSKASSKSGYKTAAPKKNCTVKKKRTASNPASSGTGAKRIRK